MSTVLTFLIESSSLSKTLELAAAIGHRLQGREVIELAGDLGSGKTAFVRGLVNGMGSKDKVHSPSFTLSNVYNAGQLELHHYDFHRLSDPGIMSQELSEVLADDNAVVAVEWADVVNDVLPDQRLIINIDASGDETRTIRVECADKFTYLFPNKT